uniref:Putative malonyl CoA:anthocyanidin 3-O-glucoside-6''-O-malonyltransferase n=1 Tax=Dahlia pinnata TaxID=101596 RepID=Q8GZM6_DAHPI|nr:putative malonyl CoA:anthocyanidin 3-O-glucoside-6''-O-malonyltransferase [Dahlia pinnata]
MVTTAGDGPLPVLEKCHISAPPNTVGERTLPLTLFDLVWLIFHPIHQLFFYDFPYPKSHFIDTIIPKLKHSLSVTLQHFFPFAGNLIVFPSANHSGKPEIRHVEGDSVALTFAESDLDFNYLKQNHPRDCNKFHALVPLLETPFKVSGLVKIPVFSIQVTFFPNSGITIGLTNHHSLCDARTRYDFLMAWTSIAKHGTDELFLASGSLPFYDRVIEYPSYLDNLILDLPPVQAINESYRAQQLDPQTDKVRFTLVLTRSQINKIKKWLLVQLPTLEYVSSFVVACGYVWSCLAKSRVQVEGAKGEYEVDRFSCVADWRTRLNPPVPQTYFGNCTGLCMATTKTTLITGSKGFQTAVELVGTGIREGVNSKQGLAEDAKSWLEKILIQAPTIGVAGTPKLNVYDIDFGWGKPEKYETISLDYADAISVNASKESSDDLEIGLCLPAEQMDAFITISTNELESILSHHF